MKDRRFSVNGSGGSSTITQRHSKATQVLSPLLDQLNEKFTLAEKVLKALQPVDFAWVPYAYEPTEPSNSDGCWQICHCVGFAKHDGEWRICIGAYHEGDPVHQPGEWEPITETSRWVRVEVASQFPKLFPRLQEEIVKATEDFASKAQEALTRITKALEHV